ncbi:PKD domain-containing protein [Halobellus sp. Atlit-31R]|nr:PKD domain-containing protein [Halobellus sp. Atlit-31R]
MRDSDPQSSRDRARNARRRWIRRAGVATLVSTVLVVSLLSGVAVADEGGEIAVQQGETCRVVNAVESGQNATGFYDYRSPSTEPYSYTYSSHGTVDYQQDDTSILLFHQGPDGTSLVIVHDRYAAADDGTNGGVASFDVSGLPAAGEWVVEDDNYAEQTDSFSHNDAESDLDWVWADNRTDGAVFTGIDNESVIRIDPAFNDAADIEPSSERRDGEITSWQLIDASGDGFERVSLDSLGDPISIRRGGCADRSRLELGLSATPAAAAVNETVTLDANASDSDSSIREYRWDVVGDDAPEAVTDEPTFEYAFASTGSYTASVTAVDETNRSGTASVTVPVGGDPPTAALTLPTETSVGESVLLNASGSAVGEPPASYEWRVDGTAVATTEEPTYEHAFESAGSQPVELLVTDGIGRTATATATVTVFEPLAAGIAPLSTPIARNETVTFDASESTGNVTAYNWSFGDGGTATGPTARHTYETTGEYTVSLTVTDDTGQSDTAATNISVGGPVQAAFDATPGTTTVNEPVRFNGTPSAGPVAAYDWAFGDNSTASGPAVRHSYRTPGEYPVTLTVVGSDGYRAQATTTVEARPADSGLTARIGAPAETAVDESVTLDGSNSTGNVTAYNWTLDDNETATGETVQHTYNATGAYDVRLTVTNESGATDTANATINVTADDDESNDTPSGGTGGSPGSGSGGAPSGGGSDDDSPSGGGAPSGGGGGGGGSGGSSAAGTPAPAESEMASTIVVTDIEAPHGVAGRPFNITLKLRNPAPIPASKTIPVRIDGDVRANVSATLPPRTNATRAVTVTVPAAEGIGITAGEAFAVSSVWPSRTNFQVTDTELETSRIEPGDEATVVVSVYNDGNVPGEYRAELTVAGSVTDVEAVRVPPGETSTARLTQQFEAPGTYTVSVNGDRYQVTVTDPGTDANESATPTESTTTETIDGFGAVAALVAVLAGVVAARRFRD